MNSVIGLNFLAFIFILVCVWFCFLQWSLILLCFRRRLGAILHLVCRGRSCKENVLAKGPDKNLGQLPAVFVAMETTLQWRAMDSVVSIWKCVTSRCLYCLCFNLCPRRATQAGSWAEEVHVCLPGFVSSVHICLPRGVSWLDESMEKMWIHR